jgi:GNAT superfamily N-acetyltransferase
MPELETPRIRPARADDADLITDFNLRLARESERLALDPRVVRAGVSAALAGPDRGFYLLAETRDGIVGQLCVTREWSDWRCAFFWWLQSVYVVPAWRRRGILRALTTRVIEMARSEDDVCGLRLYAHRENAAAIAAYRRLGLRPLDYEMIGVDLDAVE